MLKLELTKTQELDLRMSFNGIPKVKAYRLIIKLSDSVKNLIESLEQLPQTQFIKGQIEFNYRYLEILNNLKYQKEPSKGEIFADIALNPQDYKEN